MCSLVMNRGWRSMLVALMLSLGATAFFNQPTWAQEEEVAVIEETVAVEEPADLGLGYAFDNGDVIPIAACLVFIHAGWICHG